jgi:hypothetical protein
MSDRKTGRDLDQIQIICVRNQNSAAHDLDYLIQIYRIGIIIWLTCYKHIWGFYWDKLITYTVRQPDQLLCVQSAGPVILNKHELQSNKIHTHPKYLFKQASCLFAFRPRPILFVCPWAACHYQTGSEWLGLVVVLWSLLLHIFYVWTSQMPLHHILFLEYLK